MIDVLDGAYQVHFIDFGNDDMVTADLIRPISKGLMATPPGAFRCSLKGRHIFMEYTF